MSTTTLSTTTQYEWQFRQVAETDLRSDVTIALVGVVFLSIVLAILFGNIIVIIAILTYRQLKKQQSNLFILNLAFADLSVVVFVMIWTTAAYVADMGRSEDYPWIFSNVMCNLQCAMNYCLIVVSMMTLGFISIDRFVHIVYPLQYHDIITVKRIRIMICWTWIQGLIIGFIPVGMKWIHYDYCEVVCAIDWSELHAEKFVIVAFITCFIAPALTMLVCYSVIFKEIRRSTSVHTVTGSTKHNSSSEDKAGSLKKNGKKQSYGVLESSVKHSKPTENNNAETPADTPAPKIRRHSKVVKESTIVKSLLVVVLVFFVCMTPFSTTKLIKVLKGYIPCWVNTFATVIQLLASACNPLIYGIFRKEYRKAFKIQYNKACHRLSSKFTSSDYSDSFSNPYYSENKPATLKRKDLANRSVKEPVQGNETLTKPLNENQISIKLEVKEDNSYCSSTALSPSRESVESEASHVEKTFTLPRRAVSFEDTRDVVNRTTEVITL